MGETAETGGEIGAETGLGGRVRCAVSNREIKRRDGIKLDALRPTLAERIRQDHPDLPPDAYISLPEVARFRGLLVEQLLHEEHGDVTTLEREVIDSLAHHETVAENIENEFEGHRTFAERASDGLADFGGSWRFIISFGVVLVVWMAINVALASRAFDPYPFILLNLVLSCLAAIQAPIIMMSQKRQETKDRARSLNDYQVNLKAELEIRHLHEKLDHLMTRQWERLAEIQRMEIELLQDLTGRRRGRKDGRQAVLEPQDTEDPAET